MKNNQTNQDLMNLTQYAKHRNVARNEVQTEILTGGISSILDEDGKRWIDPEQV